MLRMILTKLFNCSRKGLYRRLPQTATLGLSFYFIVMVIFPSSLSLFDDEKGKVSLQSIDDILDDAKISAKSKCSHVCQFYTKNFSSKRLGNSDSGNDKK